MVAALYKETNRCALAATLAGGALAGLAAPGSLSGLGLAAPPPAPPLEVGCCATCRASLLTRCLCTLSSSQNVCVGGGGFFCPT